jgi:hypothetical protein
MEPHNIYNKKYIMKKCGKCKVIKEFDNFCKNKRYKDGFHDTCKQCRKQYNKENQDKVRQYYLDNIESIKEYNKKYIQNNIEKIKFYSKEYYNNPINKQRKKEYFQEYISNPNNKLKQQIIIKKWFKNNPEYLKGYMKNRYNNDIEYKIKNNLRSRLYHAIRGTIKFSSSLKLLGCSIEDLKGYIYTKFLPEMSWENHGEIWEIDHIIGCTNFDLTNLEEQKKCFHYTNLQPLFKTTEIAKSFGYDDQIGNRNKRKNI